jgi:hypothetical protein
MWYKESEQSLVNSEQHEFRSQNTEFRIFNKF